MKAIIISSTILLSSFIVSANSCFVAVDKDADGCIDSEEYKLITSTHSNAKPFSEVDADASGCIDLEEFEAAYDCIE